MLKVTSTVILQKQAFWGLNESGDLGGDSKKPVACFHPDMSDQGVAPGVQSHFQHPSQFAHVRPT